MFARARGRLAREDGVALIMALIVVGALTISTAAVVALSSSNQRAFARDKLQQRAFNTAEEALNVAISDLRTYDNGTVSQTTTRGTAGSPFACCSSLGRWWATKVSPTAWQIWSTGLSPNGQVLRKLSIRTTVDVLTVTTNPSQAWGYGFFVASPSGCTTMVGSSAMTSSTFINGDLCLTGTNLIAEPSSSGNRVVDLYVRGRLSISGNNAQVGLPSRTIKSANIVGGCDRSGVQKICSQSGQSKVYAATYGSTQLSLTKPAIDAAGKYASGRWSTPSCATGSFTFDTNTTRDMSVGTFDLFPASSYDCTVVDSGGAYVGRMTWNAATSQMTIDGLIYVDGNMDLAGGDQVQYSGVGTIYVNGTVATSGNSSLCGPPSTVNGTVCTGVWDASQGALAIVAVNANNVTPAWSMSGNAEYNVLVYTVGAYVESGTSFVTGPVIADSASIAGTAEHTDVPNPPGQLPGAGTSVFTSAWRVVPGSWQQLPNGS